MSDELLYEHIINTLPTNSTGELSEPSVETCDSTGGSSLDRIAEQEINQTISDIECDDDVVIVDWWSDGHLNWCKGQVCEKDMQAGFITVIDKHDGRKNKIRIKSIETIEIKNILMDDKADESGDVRNGTPLSKAVEPIMSNTLMPEPMKCVNEVRVQVEWDKRLKTGYAYAISSEEIGGRFDAVLTFIGTDFIRFSYINPDEDMHPFHQVDVNYNDITSGKFKVYMLGLVYDNDKPVVAK